MNERQLHLFEQENDSRLTARRRIIALPMDTLILSAIIVVFLLITIFSLGIERGKKITLNNISSMEMIAKKNEPKTISKDEAAKPIVSIRQLDDIPNNDSIVPPIDINTDIDGRRYRIQVASYKKENDAWQEAKTLKNKGYSAAIDKKGNYTIIIVGDFNNKQDAENKMRSLQAKYRDCFIRRL